MRTRIFFCLLLPAVLMFGVSGCGRSKPCEGKLVFALVPKLLDNPVFEVAHRGALDAAREIGNIEILWKAPVEADAAKQVEVIEGLISRGVDGLAISANEPDYLIDVINRAVDAGIPTITFDSDSPRSRRITFFGTNNYEGGKRCAELLVKFMGERGKIAIMTGVLGAHNLEERIRGVKDALRNYPHIEIVTIRACNDNTAQSIREIEAVMQAHPDLNGWIFVGGWPLFVAPPGAFESIGTDGRVKVVSFDTLPDQLRYVELGYVQALVGQKYYEWGYESVRILKGIIDGKKYESFTDSGLDIVTAENVKEFMNKWRTK